VVDGYGGLPVGGAAGVAGSGVGAEDLGGVIGGGLELVAVGGDHGEAGPPLVAAGWVVGLVSEEQGPVGSSGGDLVGEMPQAIADLCGGVSDVRGEVVLAGCARMVGEDGGKPGQRGLSERRPGGVLGLPQQSAHVGVGFGAEEDCLSRGTVMFGCFQRPGKLGPQILGVASVWGRVGGEVLGDVPGEEF
jgi:hypothetical protein